MDEATRKFWHVKFEELGVMRRGHFRLHSGLHSDAYINKDALYTSPSDLFDFCNDAIQLLLDVPFDIIVGPESGGAKLALVLAGAITKFFANKDESYIWTCAYAETENGKLVFKRGQAASLDGKNVLVVDDVLVTGDSVNKTISAVRAAGGKPVRVFVIWDRSGDNFQLSDVNIISFDKLSLPAWDEAVCYLCKLNKPLDEEFV